ncbi:Aminoglycoside phosphotransferase [Penicillium chermesinum]|uniref:Aminoglycoside phosphotransferase n=1 Tax=Penicillium chermesinum TaxID=63820 RepID=A0A9W9TRW1_9EURO|nr:Aminoglycoside phosphotransferase [Penicillium chermesinum]KAJ5238448.1 Aminoglycoside phosphotransferase [Penicillium chermesinum]
MDYMSGKRLDEVWDILDSSPKVSIADELHSYINQLRDLKGEYIGAVDRGKAILRHYAKYAFTDNHDIVFTHSDIAPRNILVEGGHVTAILDWEDAGWYPAYWEYYTRALRQLKPVPDWPEYLPVIFLPNMRENMWAWAS